MNRKNSMTNINSRIKCRRKLVKKKNILAHLWQHAYQMMTNCTHTHTANKIHNSSFSPPNLQSLPHYHSRISMIFSTLIRPAAARVRVDVVGRQVREARPTGLTIDAGARTPSIMAGSPSRHGRPGRVIAARMAPWLPVIPRNRRRCKHRTGRSVRVTGRRRGPTAGAAGCPVATAPVLVARAGAGAGARLVASPRRGGEMACGRTRGQQWGGVVSSHRIRIMHRPTEVGRGRVGPQHIHVPVIIRLPDAVHTQGGGGFFRNRAGVKTDAGRRTGV